jgi:N-acetylmuramoyl-L-alanine amidase
LKIGGRDMRFEKKKIRFISILVLTASIITINFISSQKASATPCDIENSKLILIDPGHGGVDGGAVSRSGVIEKYINLSIGIMLRDELKKNGYQIIMTREDDRGLYTENGDAMMMKKQDLNNRCKLKRESNCDLYISIHQNYFADSKCRGAQVWFSRNEESKSFAHILQENLKKDLGSNHRVEKEAKDAYKILRCYTNIPSVIVECGFLSNYDEEKKLTATEYQKKVTSTIVKSIQEYYQHQ